MTRPPSPFGILKWPSLLLTLVAPLVAYPSWNPPVPPLKPCGTLRTEHGQFAVYGGRTEDGQLERRFVPIAGTVDNAPPGDFPDNGTFEGGAWRVTISPSSGGGASAARLPCD